jgi:hypothetical protein
LKPHFIARHREVAKIKSVRCSIVPRSLPRRAVAPFFLPFTPSKARTDFASVVDDAVAGRGLFCPLQRWQALNQLVSKICQSSKSI